MRRLSTSHKCSVLPFHLTVIRGEHKIASSNVLAFATLLRVVATASLFWHSRGLHKGVGTCGDESDREMKKRHKKDKKHKAGGTKEKRDKKDKKQEEGGKVKKHKSKEKSKKHKGGGKDRGHKEEDGEMRCKDMVSRQFENTSSIAHTHLNF